MLSLVLLASCLVQLAVGKPLLHGWDTVGDMFYAHGNQKTVLPSDAVAFLAKHYKIATFGNCYGADNGTMESAVLQTSTDLKLINPSIKAVFYWKSDITEQITACSDANETFSRHPEWLFRDDKGHVVRKGANPVIDLTNDACAAFWAGHLIDLAKVRLPGSSTPVLDGFFIDGVENVPDKPSEFQNVSDARWNALLQAKFDTIARLQEALDEKDQFALTNGMDTAWSMQKTARAGAAMVDHFAILQFINRTTGEMLPDAMAELLFNVIRNPLTANRTLEIKGWPGPIIQQRDVWAPSYPQPKTPAEFRQQATAFFNNALSYFLLVAEANTWWEYSWFWANADDIPTLPNSTVPADFFPQLQCPLGPPLEDPQHQGGYKWTRRFQHASVVVDLESRKGSYVDFEHC